MKPARPARGGSPVGLVAELPPIEASAVLCLRLWCDGPAWQERIRSDFAAVLGTAGGDRAARALGELCEAFVLHGRRPLMRHHAGCKCLGADEACFANLIAAAGEGEREDALLIATLLVRPDCAFLVAERAQTLGLALKRIAIRTSATTHEATPGPLH